MKTKVITAHIPIELANKVDKLAIQTERSRGWIVKQALDAWVAQEEERKLMTEEALADVDAKRTVDHSVIESWVNELDKKK